MTLWVTILMCIHAHNNENQHGVWPYGMFIFAGAKVNMVHGDANFRLGKNRHGAIICMLKVKEYKSILACRNLCFLSHKFAFLNTMVT